MPEKLVDIEVLAKIGETMGKEDNPIKSIFDKIGSEPDNSSNDSLLMLKHRSILL